MATIERKSSNKAQDDGLGSIQLVSFCLGKEEYGIEITRVREIILLDEITQVPQTPDYVMGLINLRSTVIPIVDLRIRFGLPQNDFSDDTRIMVLNIQGKMVGIVVDAVSEVLRVSSEEIVPSPPTVAGLGREYLSGLVQLQDRLLILLDVDRILGNEETSAIEAVVASL